MNWDSTISDITGPAIGTQRGTTAYSWCLLVLARII
jgi:hypothetical protein